jgi:hypothetical protein
MGGPLDISHQICGDAWPTGRRLSTPLPGYQPHGIAL